MSQRVLVLLGTDHHPFHRLIEWVEAVSDAADGLAITVQHGFTQAPTPGRWSYVEFLSHDALMRTLEESDAVVCHGGPGTIDDCRKAGLIPVVVPRSAAEGEHVDDHQVLYSARLEKTGLISRAISQDSFTQSLDAALTRGRRDLGSEDAVSIATTVSRFEHEVNAVLARRRSRRSRKA